MIDSDCDVGIPGAVKIRVERLPEAADLPAPEYMSERAAGMDLRAAVADDTTLAPGEIALIPTGLRLAIPPGYEGQVRPRSGLALKHGITIPNSPGTIDADYRGPVCVIIANSGREPFVIHRGDRIAQLVIAPVVHAEIEIAERLDDTARAEGGFGHTGR
jgi:dUTP pyrophosphatase